MNLKLINLNLLKIIVLILLVVLPWLNANYFDEISAVPPSQEDLSFYEINPCKVSVAEFLIENFESTYQDHFFFRFNDYSSISCFGRISGVTLVNNGFYVSVGTNSLINFLLQGMFWCLLISFIRPGKKELEISNKIYLASLIATTYFFCFSIHAEDRFYSQKFYFLDLGENISYLILFIFIFFILKIICDLFISRFYSSINYLPFVFLVIGVFGGFNLTIYSLVFVYFGIVSFLVKENNKHINKILYIFSIFWILSASGRYSFNPGKLRGFTSSAYEFNAVLYWTIFFIFLLNGLLFFYRRNLRNIDYRKLVDSFSYTSLIILFLGLFGSNFPFVNFLNYYYFGQQKYGVKILNPFISNEWGEKIAWRGFYPSAESIGEFFGLTFLLILFLYFSSKKIQLIDIVGVISSLFGLYFSNNRSALVIVLVSASYLFLRNYKLNKTINLIIYLIIGSSILFIVGFQNINLPYSYTSEIIFREAIGYQYESISSSFVEFISRSNKENNIFSILYGFFGFIAYILNRAELWGLFTSRYNPSFWEILVGTGPFNFGQLYGEIIVGETKSFLLPHSSFLSFVLFFGIVGVLILTFYLVSRVYKSRNNINDRGYILLSFVFLNFVKNDAANYFATFFLYTFILFIVIKTKRKKLFNSSRVDTIDVN